MARRIGAAAAVLAAIFVAMSTGLVSPVAAELVFPDPDGFVVDGASVVPAQTEVNLERQLADFEQRTSDEIAIAVVHDPGGVPIELYAQQLFNIWGVGQAGKDNGVLLVVALADRRLRIQVGDGLDARLPDRRAQSIVDQTLVPYLRVNDVAGALRAGAASIRRALGDDLHGLEVPPPSPRPATDLPPATEVPTTDVSPGFSPDVSPPSEPSPSFPWAVVPIGGLVVGAAVLGLVYGNKCPNCGTRLQYESGGFFRNGNDVCPSCGYSPHRSNSSTWGSSSGGFDHSSGGGVSSSSGSGEGGSSSGGGHSSGGGASGSW